MSATLSLDFQRRIEDQGSQRGVPHFAVLHHLLLRAQSESATSSAEPMLRLPACEGGLRVQEQPLACSQATWRGEGYNASVNWGTKQKTRLRAQLWRSNAQTCCTRAGSSAQPRVSPNASDLGVKFFAEASPPPRCKSTARRCTPHPS